MIYCPKCGIANREGSRFCNDCGTKLPSSTSIHCPQCGTPNPPHNVFCEQCNARLIPALADDASESEPSAPLKKGLSLPTKPAAAEAQPAGDWLDQLRSSLEPASESGEHAAEESAPAKQPGQSPPKTVPAEDEVPDWLTSLGIINPKDNQAAESSTEMPEWLIQTPPSAPIEEHPPEPEPAAWLSSLRQSATPPAEDDVPDWLRELGTAPLAAKPAAAAATPADQPTGYEEEIPEWMQSLGTGALVPPSSTEQPADTSAEPVDWLSDLRAATTSAPEPSTTTAIPSAEEDVPEWLRSLGTGILKPSSAEPPPTPVEPPPPPTEPWLNALRASVPPPEEDIPDWLQNLGTGALAPMTPLAEPAEPSEEIPEWLRNLGTGALTLPESPQPAAEGSIEPVAAEEQPELASAEDWLSALRAAAPQAVEPQPESPPPAAEEPIGPALSAKLPETEAAEDWLSALRSAAPQAAELQPEPSSEEVPEWLKRLGTGALMQPESTPPAAEEPSVPATLAVQPEPEAAEDWLSTLRAAAPQATQPEPSSQEVPEWLRSLGTGALTQPESAPSAAESPIVPATPAKPTESVASEDWLSALRSAAPPAAEQQAEPTSEEVPEWLRNLGTGELTQSESAPPITEESIEPVGSAKKPEPPAAEGIPDWLSNLRAAAPSFETKVTPEVSAAPEEPEELPSWLQSGDAPTPAESAESVLPDWLSTAGETPTAAEAAAPTPQMPPTVEPAAEEIPDWLRDVSTPAAPTTPAMAESEVPDWLRETAAAASSQAPTPTEAAELPDWLREGGAAATTEQPKIEEALPEEPTAEAGLASAEIPDWLKELQPETGVASAAKVETPARKPSSETTAAVATGLGAAFSTGAKKSREPEAASAELPDWLKSLREGQPAAPARPSEPAPGLIQAEIPSWLEALRPREGAAGSLAEIPEESEQEGVLAGLANVLPAAPSLGVAQGAAAQLRREPSADDLARAGIFQELLARPASAPTPIITLPGRGLRMNRWLAQVVVGVLLLLFVSEAFIFDHLPILPVIDSLPSSSSIQAAVTTIGALAPTARVLVVFDYDATQAGELNQIAATVLRHVQSRGANITTASLNPQGAGLARSVWESIGVTPTTSTIFVPGQAVGVQSLLLSSGPYDLVIDLSATADNVRWWVEQIAVSGLSVKFIAGVSAGAESLALPYAQSKQIAGLISGAIGALQYVHQAKLLPTVEEALQAWQVAKQTNQAPSMEVVETVRGQIRLESQTLAHWFMIGIIVIGLIGGLLARAGRRSP